MSQFICQQCGVAIGQWAELVSEEHFSVDGSLLRAATTVQVVGHCPILDDELSYGLGFATTTDRRRLGPNPGAFGHYGTGGSLGFADPVDGIAFGYVMNHVIPRWQSTRNRALIEAVYASLA